MANRKLISFDWAIKKILRSKANFVILEGFLSSLLNTPLKIDNIIDSESNKDNAEDKSNRVDIKVQDKDGKIIIIEVQFTREYDYLNRMLYGVSKVLVEHIDQGDSYENVVKVISLNIVFMNLGIGDDYVYHGTTNFRGIHSNNLLHLTTKEQQALKSETVADCYPEYYVIDVSNFDDLAKTSLDQWIYFLKNEEIRSDFNAPGIKEAQEKLDILKLDNQVRKQYEYYIDYRRREFSRYESGKMDGREEGLEEGLEQGIDIGLEKGREEGALAEKMKIARSLKGNGSSNSLIISVTGLSEDELLGLQE